MAPLLQIIGPVPVVTKNVIDELLTKLPQPAEVARTIANQNITEIDHTGKPIAIKEDVRRFDVCVYHTLRYLR